MSFGPSPTNGTGGKRGGRGGGGGGRPKAAAGVSGAAAIGRADIQERLRELQSRRDAWMQQRDHTLGASPTGAVSQTAVEKSEPRKPQPPPSTSVAADAGSSGLLSRVRLELDDIEREVRASAGLPRSSPAAAAASAGTTVKSEASSFGGGGSLRPVSHFCPACGRLMLGSAVAPQLLAPCGHSVCTDCSPRPEETPPPLRCPHCGLRVSGVRPDAALRAAIEAFSCGGGTAGVAAVGSASSTTDADAAAGAAAARRWLQQLDVISGRMRQLDASMESLQAEVAQLTGQLDAEASRDRQLAASEAATRKEIGRLQAELRSLGEQRAVSRDNQTFIQSEIDAKKDAIQGAFASQQLVSQELAKLQRLCAA